MGELGALLAQASLVVSNNTGPAHIAAAVGTPVVDLYALTNPQHTPWRVPNRVLNHDVDCRYCHRSVCPGATTTAWKSWRPPRWPRPCAACWNRRSLIVSGNQPSAEPGMETRRQITAKPPGHGYRDQRPR
ncbi:glycosyltransferase family 9 protein [Massilia sp. Se16.2.3]|uniref:glycosyltransferase family 9 protein n=1 Tax=Massilia sp. Se16.2.3 TaxID=2709303 RepID=UPI0035A5B786